MFVYLILLFTCVPIIELAVLLSVGRHIGVFNTIAVVILTGVTGAYLAKSQGLMILSKIQSDLRMGMMPGDKLIDGALILVGGVLLLTPGFITDATGFAVLVPYSRYYIKKWLKNQFQKNIKTHTYIDHDSLH
jgi:UPF0716 protein FxsA